MVGAQEPQGDVLFFDSFEGTFVSANRSTLKIATGDGHRVFQLAKLGEDLPQLGVGRGTAISVSGVDRVSFLKLSMVVRFVAEFDKTGPTNKPLESIEVLALSDKLDTFREPISEPDPQTGLMSYRFTARIQSINLQTKRLGVIVRPRNKPERYEFELDPENTRVRYDLPELSLAQPGEETLVRCLPFPGEPQVASEVRVTRPSPFPDVTSNDASDTAAEADNPNPLRDIEGLAEAADPASLDGDDPSMQNNPDEDPDASEIPEPDAVLNEAERSDDVVEFDFDAPAPSEPTFDYGVLSALLGIDISNAKPEEHVEVPVGPKKLERRPVRHKNPVGRGWYKIN